MIKYKYDILFSPKNDAEYDLVMDFVDGLDPETFKIQFIIASRSC